MGACCQAVNQSDVWDGARSIRHAPGLLQSPSQWPGAMDSAVHCVSNPNNARNSCSAFIHTYSSRSLTLTICFRPVHRPFSTGNSEKPKSCPQQGLFFNHGTRQSPYSFKDYPAPVQSSGRLPTSLCWESREWNRDEPLEGAPPPDRVQKRAGPPPQFDRHYPP